MDHLRRELYETKAELEQKETEINNVRAQLRRVVGELNRSKVRGQAVSQATDQEIFGKVELLRYEIRGFAFQHFETRLSEDRIQAACESMQNRLRLPPNKLRDYLTSPTRRSSVIRSYVWLVLIEKVAGLYYWCGSQISEAMQRMEGLLCRLNDVASLRPVSVSVR